jgi:hypothetical protein
MSRINTEREVSRKLSDAFQCHANQPDLGRLQATLQLTLGDYPLWGIHDQTVCRRVVAEAVFTALKAKQEDALKAIVETVATLPGLWDGVRMGIRSFNENIVRENMSYNSFDAENIPGLSIFKAQRELSLATQEYILAIIESLPGEDDNRLFPQVFRQVCGTPYRSLVQIEHMHSYLRGEQDSDIANAVPIFQQDPDMWNMFLEAAKDAKYFIVRLPDSVINDLKTTDFHLDDAPYFIGDIGMDAGYLLLNYSFAIDQDDIKMGQINSSWIDFVHKNDLMALYSTFWHAREVIKGNRAGGVIQDSDCLDTQRQFLLPVLDSDVMALERAIQMAGLALPQVPLVIASNIPNGLSTQNSLPGGGRYDHSAHRRFFGS